MTTGRVPLAFPLSPIAKSANYTACPFDFVVVSGQRTITLPAPVRGTCVGVQSVDGTGAAPCTVTTPSGLIIGPGLSAASCLLGALGAYVVLLADGTNWSVVAGNQDTGWLALTLNTSYSNYSGGFDTAAARKVGTLVSLRGLVKYGTISSYAAWTPVAASGIPAGMRPVGANKIFTTIGSYVGGTNLAFRTDVNADGSIVGGATSGVNWTGDYLSFEGITYNVA